MARNELIAALKACQSAAIKRLGEEFGKGHRTGGSCAEIMAALAYVQFNDGKLPTNDARVVTVTTDEDADGKQQDVIRTPCSKADERQGSFGCQQTLKQFGEKVKVIPDKTKREAIGDISFGDVAFQHVPYP